eukprot:TRINITY_DN817_c0_g2_i2.p1 TRINITY_DN817_c0_g2~~TRINITY_DN817_c0_g2_i2.p1  ORF type:complete len:165 (+),score=41.77 TRINITY_DN817_c0_g2_i2:88-582(+)
MSLRQATSSLRSLALRAAQRSKHTLPDLPYEYGALEPHISGAIMELHHSKHHNTYVTNLNAALEQADAFKADGNADGLVGLQGAIKFNGGGHVNHSLFWNNLAPTSEGGGVPPEGPLAQAIDAQVCSLTLYLSLLPSETVSPTPTPTVFTQARMRRIYFQPPSL